MIVRMWGAVMGVAVVAAVGMSGCTATGAASPPHSSASAEAGKNGSAGTKASLKVGSTYTYPDGVAVTVISLSQFTIPADAEGGQPGDAGVKVTVRITNGTKKTGH